MADQWYDAQWYVLRNGKSQGPFTTAHLKQFAAKGKLLPTDKVQRDGTDKWIAARSLKGLFPLIAPPPLPVADFASKDDAVPVAIVDTVNSHKSSHRKRGLDKSNAFQRFLDEALQKAKRLLRRLQHNESDGSKTLILRGLVAACLMFACLLMLGLCLVAIPDSGRKPSKQNNGTRAAIAPASKEKETKGEKRINDAKIEKQDIPKVDYSKGPNGEPLEILYDRADIESHYTKIFLRLCDQSGVIGLCNFTTTIRGYKDADGKSRIHGLCCTFYPTGEKLWEQHFYDNEPHGFRSFWYKNGNKESESWALHGKAHGSWRMWTMSGTKTVEGTYVNGLREGHHTAWYPSGVKKHEGQMKEGEENGLWTYYRENGDKLSEISKVQGKDYGPYTTYYRVAQGGGKGRTGQKINNLDEGECTVYYENGKIQLSEMYRNGRRNGKTYMFNSDGKLSQIVTYVSDQAIGSEIINP